MNAAVIGAGGWGTALARVLHERGHAVTMWAHREDFADELRHTRENATYLPGVTIDPAIEISHDTDVLAHNDLYLFTLPSQATREVARSLASVIRNEKALYVSGSKGIEQHTHCRITEVIADAVGIPIENTASLSGPSHAEE